MTQNQNEEVLMVDLQHSALKWEGKSKRQNQNGGQITTIKGSN